jgi:hypothetical protein
MSYTLEVRGQYNTQNQYNAVIGAQAGSALSKVIQVKTKFKQNPDSNEEAIYIFFIVTANASQPLPGQYWQGSELHVIGDLEFTPSDDEWIGAIVIYEEDSEISQYDYNFENFLKNYIKSWVNKPGVNLDNLDNYINHFQLGQKIQSRNARIRASFVLDGVPAGNGDIEMPPMEVGSGGILKPGSI